MEKTLRMSLLFDIYGSLLTDRQQEMFVMYFHEDLSLAEVGQQLAVTRQAVYDVLKRAESIMEDLENKLGLLTKHQRRQELYNELHGRVKNLKDLSKKCTKHLQGLEDIILHVKNSS